MIDIRSLPNKTQAKARSVRDSQHIVLTRRGKRMWELATIRRGPLHKSLSLIAELHGWEPVVFEEEQT